eukprot:TRINITY_DN7581_c1_g1_i1.p1 TRINITY_DN7581_c1_g1~~TRINITY_DN7581_c1_g1_i1.p1  ORF type:complete len:327 (+),score=60.84 TRINITY_DN7581_c1_g1_i1:87-983(+)
MSETKSALNEPNDRLIPVQQNLSSPRLATESVKAYGCDSGGAGGIISEVQSEAVVQQYVYATHQQYAQYFGSMQQQQPIEGHTVQQVEGRDINYSAVVAARQPHQNLPQSQQPIGAPYPSVNVQDDEANVAVTGKGGAHRGGLGGGGRGGKQAGVPGTSFNGSRVVNAAPQGPPGLFGPDDWACTSCGNVNWARRPKCNLCGAPKPGTVDQTRQGVGGGFKELDEKEIEEAKQRRKRFEEEDDDIYDDFGRVKKRHRTQQQQNSIRNGGGSNNNNYNKDKKGGKQKGALERLQGEWLV